MSKSKSIELVFEENWFDGFRLNKLEAWAVSQGYVAPKIDDPEFRAIADKVHAEHAAKQAPATAASSRP